MNQFITFSNTVLNRIAGVFDIANAVFSKSKSVSSEDTTPRDVTWNNDGSKMYVAGDAGNDINEYDLTTEFDIGTATFSKLKSVSSEDTGVQGMAWNNDGSKMYVVGATNDNVYEYDLTTEFDIGTATFSKSKDVSGQDTLPTGMTWNNDGSKMYVVGATNDNVYEYDLTTEFDIGTATFSKSKSITSEDTVATGVVFNNNGSKMYVIGLTSDNVNEYDLTTNFDIATATFSKSKDVSGQDINPQGMAWNSDGSKMYVVGSTGDSVYEYDVG